MKKILLNKRTPERGLFALIDDRDFENVNQYNWYITTFGYAASNGVNKNKHPITMHRFLFQELDKKMDIDHIDRNKLNNTRGNLRIATRSQNMANMNKPNVYWIKKYGKWHARVVMNYKKHHVGYFDDKETAIQAYQIAKKELFGDYAPEGGL